MFIRDCMLAALIVLAVVGQSHGARILALFPFPGKSHTICYTALTRALAEQGHQVTVVSSFPQDPPVANYTDIVVKETWPEKSNTDIFKMKDSYKIAAIFFFWYMGTLTCDRALGQEDIQKLINDKDLQFDLVIISDFLSECFNGFAHKFKAPIIHISANTATLAMGSFMGNPVSFSYIPDLLLGLEDHMTFCDRIWNTVYGTFVSLMRELYYLPQQNAIMRRHFNDPDMPGISQLETEAAFLLLNSHLAFNSPRPFTPNTAEVGGMHIKASKKLPKDLQQFLDNAPEGVVYFSLGSNVRSSAMPDDKRNALLQVFSGLKQKVLWKWETDVLPGQPKNVRLGKWLPQNDILAHPNVKVFITHGGLLSSQEAVYHGVPVLALPVFGDQILNAIRAEKAGYGLRVNFDNVTKESVSQALNKLLTQPSYRENIKQRAAIFHDQPQKPLDRAVFWTEYVLRHKGAPHMRSAALDLAWYQYHLLDVIFVLVGGTVAGLAVVFLVCRTVFRRIFGRGRQTVASKKANKSKKIN